MLEERKTTWGEPQTAFVTDGWRKYGIREVTGRTKVVECSLYRLAWFIVDSSFRVQSSGFRYDGEVNGPEGKGWHNTLEGAERRIKHLSGMKYVRHRKPQPPACPTCGRRYTAKHPDPQGKPSVPNR